MELTLTAPFAGTVTEVDAAAGRQVPLGATLFVVAGAGGRLVSLPMVVPEAGLPERVTIYEVGPRDGLQNEAAIVPVEVKAEFVRRLVAAGLPVVEATSFVHPKWVPQLADAEQLMTGARRRRPRPAGARAQRARPRPRPRARDASRRDLRLRHRDVRPEEPQPRARRAVRDVRAGRWPVRARPGSTSAPTCRCASATRGRATCLSPRWWRPDGACSTSAPPSSASATPSASARPATSPHWSPRSPTPACRPTGSRCTSTTPTARRSPTCRPGCGPASPPTTPAPAASAAAPTPKSATGNLATEDLVWLLTGLGIAHGVDLAAVAATSTWMAGHLGRPSPSAVVRALSG